MQVCIFEDTSFRNLLPLVYLRPVYELRCGALSLREKIELLFPRARIVLGCRPELAAVLSEEYPSRPVNSLSVEDTWFVNGRHVAGDDLKTIIRTNGGRSMRYIQDDALAAAFVDREALASVHAKLKAGEPIPSVFRPLPEVPFNGTMIRYPWDCVRYTSEEISRDFRRLRLKSYGGRIPPGVFLVNRKTISIGKGTILKPGVVIDASDGPVIIGSNVLLMPNAVIMGPACIGDNSVVKAGARIYHGTSIGPWCKVGGEIDASVFQSYSNKQHDGFLGHSYLGSWVNLGADTNTSDLKNTYGTVTVRAAGGSVDTGLQFVGLTMGDHSKSGINVMFDTGTVAGVSCNIFGADLPPKYVPSFSWGGGRGWSQYMPEKACETARRVMARRNTIMSDAYERLFRDVFVRTAPERSEAGMR